MSLLSEAMTSCVLKLKTMTADGNGGTSTVWEDGSSFQAAIVYGNPADVRRAERAEIENKYTVITPRTTTLVFGDHFQRLSDGKLFRVTSDGTDKKTPASASLDMRAVTAEELGALPT